MKKWEDARKELLQDPAVRVAFDQLAPEYELACQIIKFRLSKKLTQAQLAERAGVKQSYIARLESGTANPTLDSVAKVAAVLDKRIKLVAT